MSIFGSMFGCSPSAKEIAKEIRQQQLQEENRIKMNKAFIEARKEDPSIIGVSGNIKNGTFNFIKKETKGEKK